MTSLMHPLGLFVRAMIPVTHRGRSTAPTAAVECDSWHTAFLLMMPLDLLCQIAVPQNTRLAMAAIMVRATAAVKKQTTLTADHFPRRPSVFEVWCSSQGERGSAAAFSA
jgi:hypothetical protein